MNTARRYSLGKAMSKPRPKRRLINLNRAATVGILFEVSDDHVYQQVHKYIQELQEHKIRARAMGYVREKHLSAHFLPMLSFDFIYQKDLNWFGLPVSKRTKDFIEAEFDICINIGSPECFPLKYITCRSSSPLKVGPYTDRDKEYYDIMIKPEENHDQIRFMQQVHNYLSILNPKEHA